nr:MULTISPECIES: FAD-dependent oxidoreductase [unclassified Mesorhizobium]
MRIVVLGGGVVGVTTAYQLQRDGHDVALIERNAQVAAETSWGNAGMIAPGHSFVWSSPKAPITLLKSLVLKDQALRFKFSADPRLYTWSWLFLMECTAAKARRNTLLKHRLAAYSQAVLREVVADEQIDYDRNDRGIVYFHRSQQALDNGVEHMKLLQSDGQEIKVLDRDAIVALDPSLASAKDKIAGGIYCPTDETGDPAKFTRALAAKIIARGGAIHTGTKITGIETTGDAVAQVLTDKEPFKGDAYVLALGATVLFWQERSAFDCRSTRSRAIR